MRFKKVMIGLGFAALFGPGTAVSAATIDVPNGSFESPDTAATSSTVDNWDRATINAGIFSGTPVVGEQGIDIDGGSTASHATAAHGSQFLYMHSNNGLLQVTSASALDLSPSGAGVGTMFEDQEFTLTVAVGRPLLDPDDADTHADIFLQLVKADDEALDINLQVMASVEVFAPDNTAKGTFQDQQLFYTATAGDADRYLGIRLVADERTTSGGEDATTFDHVRLEATIPEPASLALLAWGLIVPALRRRGGRG